MAVVGFGNLEEPRQRGIVVLLCKIGFSEREDWIQPIRFEARRFMELTEFRFRVAGLQAARVLLESIEPPRTLPFGEVRQAQYVMAVARRLRSPKTARVQNH